MIAEIKNPYKTLPAAGYVMRGTSNEFRRIFVKIPSKYRTHSFHAYVSHDEETISIHVDKSKWRIGERFGGRGNEDFAFKEHETVHRSRRIDEEVERIRSFEN